MTGSDGETREFGDPGSGDDRQHVAVVTGAGRRRGIGRAIAHRLATDGFAVVVHERAAPDARELRRDEWEGAANVAREIIELGGRACHVGGDLLDPATPSLIMDAAAGLGTLTCVVNNAGTAGDANSYRAHDTPDEVWEDTLAINLTSVHRVTRAAVEQMSDSTIANRSIVNISSTAAQRVLPWYGAYCVSKAAVERLTQQQALELAPLGIRVNAVSPGSTSTDMIDGTLRRVVDRTGVDPDRLHQAVLKQIPLRRFADPSEIAGAVSFLTGPDARFVTGQILTVDGGMTLA